MDNQDKHRGFVGISDLISEISDVDEDTNSTLKLEKASIHGSILMPENDLGSESEHSCIAGSRRKSSESSGWKWALVILGIFVVIGIADREEQGRKTPSPTNNTYKNQSSRRTLSQDIENGKVRAKQMEAQIRDIDSRLEYFEQRMEYYRISEMTDEYNALVPSFNSLVGERKVLFEKYSNLINEVNSKIKRYKSEYR